MKKRNNLFKKIMCLLFTFCVLLPYVPVYAGDSSAYKLTLQMSAGETKYIKLTDVTQDVVFKSNKNSVAFISNEETEEGYLITARSKGTAKITAKVNGKTISITVKVK